MDESSFFWRFAGESNDGKKQRVEFIVHHDDIAIGTASDLKIDETLQVLPCETGEDYKHVVKTKPDAVNDELNPYIGQHPGAVFTPAR